MARSPSRYEVEVRCVTDAQAVADIARAFDLILRAAERRRAAVVAASVSQSGSDSPEEGRP